MDQLTIALIIEVLLVGGALGPMQYGANMMRLGRYKDALPVLRAYYACSRIIPRWRGPLANYLCACYVGMGEFALAQPYAEEAVRENTRRRYGHYLATSRAYLGIILVRQGDFAEAEQLFRETLAQTIPPRLRASVELYAANGYINLGHQAEAERLLKGVLSGAKNGSDVQVVAELNLSLCCLYQDRAEDALEAARRAARPKAPNPNIGASVLTQLLLCLTETHQLDEAQDMAGKVIPLLPGMDNFRRGAALRALAELALRKNDLERARDYAERAATLGSNPNTQANTLLIQAEVFAARHNTHRAVSLCQDILAMQAVRFYKDRAQSLIDRLQPSPAVSVPTTPDTLASSPAQAYLTPETDTDTSISQQLHSDS